MTARRTADSPPPSLASLLFQSLDAPRSTAALTDPPPAFPSSCAGSKWIGA